MFYWNEKFQENFFYWKVIFQKIICGIIGKSKSLVWKAKFSEINFRKEKFQALISLGMKILQKFHWKTEFQEISFSGMNIHGN